MHRNFLVLKSVIHQKGSTLNFVTRIAGNLTATSTPGRNAYSKHNLIILLTSFSVFKFK